MVIDPNAPSADGTVALAGTDISHDGRFVAYGIAQAGSDWNVWQVHDLASGKDLPDRLKWIKFSHAEWSPDSGGFFYGRFPEPKTGEDMKGANYEQRVYYHRLGTAQQDDKLVWENPEHKEWRANPKVTDDGALPCFDDRQGDRQQVPGSLSAVRRGGAETSAPGGRLRRGLVVYRQ